MTRKYYTPRPRVQIGITWDGTNASEFKGFLYSQITLTPNADGTAEVNRYGDVETVQIGDPIGQDGTVLGALQELPAQVCDYVVTAVS